MAKGDVTQILDRLTQGDQGAFDELLPVVYAELRSLAAHYLRGERSGHTLQPTALTHEAYLRLLGEMGSGWNSRAHFFSVAARAMRQILIEHARRRNAKKRGGDWTRIAFDSSHAAADEPDLDLLALDAALDELARSDPRKARVVELLYFGGLTAEEAGHVLGVTGRTVERDWRFARLWLLREILGPQEPEGS